MPSLPQASALNAMLPAACPLSTGRPAPLSPPPRPAPPRPLPVALTSTCSWLRFIDLHSSMKLVNTVFLVPSRATWGTRNADSG